MLAALGGAAGPRLALGGGAEATATSDRAVAKTASRARSRTAKWRPAVVLVAAVMVVLAGCGSPRPSAGSGPVFPGTPAGAQARWFFQALGRLPIPDAAIRAHFAHAFLAQNSPAYVNARLAGAGQLRLVSVTPKGPNLVVFVMSVRGAQRFRVEVPVDTHGRIITLRFQELAPTVSPASVLPALAPGWVAQPVTFQAGGVMIYGTYTHPRSAAAGSIPAAVLLGGSGSATDRNDNSPGTPHCNLLNAVANWLSADGVASLRYDKLGSGQTRWGAYAAHPGRVGIKPYEQEAVAALNFLTRQPQVDRARLAVFGHSEGGIYALLLASGLAGHAPRVRAVGLLEPVPIPFVNLIEQSSNASLALEVRNGLLTAAQARSLKHAIARAVTSLRRTGTLPPGLPDGLAATFHGNGTPLELSQISRYDPAAVAAKLPAHTAVLLTCSNADGYFGCGEVNRLAAGLSKASARLDYVHLNGVDHVLKEDITKSPATFGQPLPFSAQLRAALKTFLASNL
jgi:predicted esterase